MPPNLLFSSPLICKEQQFTLERQQKEKEINLKYQKYMELHTFYKAFKISLLFKLHF